MLDLRSRGRGFSHPLHNNNGITALHKFRIIIIIIIIIIIK